MISLPRFFSKLCLSFVLVFPSIVAAQYSLPSIDFEKVEDERNTINYTLDQIITQIEDSISKSSKVIIPKDATEFERALFQARKNQYGGDQLSAIKQLKTLLEFECYRTNGEELYIRLLLGYSINYLGAPQVAHNYFKGVFPEMLRELKNVRVGGLLINRYGKMLVKIDSLEEALRIFELNLFRYLEVGDLTRAYKVRNDLGYVYMRMGKYTDSKSLFSANQNDTNISMSPVIHAFSFGNYGSVLIKEEKFDSALFYLNKEIDLLLAIPSTDGIHNAYLKMGNIYVHKNELDSVRKYYDLSIHYSNLQGSLQHTVNAYKALIKLYAKKEQATELSGFIDQYLAYNDSLKKIVNLSAAKNELQVSQFLTFFHETENSKRRYDTLNGKTNSLIYTIVGLTVIILLMGLTWSAYVKNRKNLKSKNLESKEKNNELNTSYQLTSDSNERNQILLKELHHRVKNNLQIISSLFNLQLNASGMEVETERVFKDARNRIYSISLVHKKIYQSNNIDSLDFEEYLRDFSDELFNATPNDVNLSIEILRNPISIESAIPLGLIFNELFTNSIQHAGRHDSLQIKVFYEELHGREKFIYTDNGVGVQNTELMKESDSSIGVTLIHLLGKQLDANIEYKEAKDVEHGFWLSIEGNFS